jgi:hypothetical protein
MFCTIALGCDKNAIIAYFSPTSMLPRMIRFARRILQAGSAVSTFIEFIIFAITAVLAEDERGFQNQPGAVKRWVALITARTIAGRRHLSYREPLRPIGELFLATTSGFYRHRRLGIPARLAPGPGVLQRRWKTNWSAHRCTCQWTPGAPGFYATVVIEVDMYPSFRARWW